MGVRGLKATLERRGNPVDLISIAKKQERPLTILVDFYVFSSYLSETFISYSPDEDLLFDADALRRYEFCELFKVRAIVWAFIQVLKNHNIEVEFFGDGAYKIGTEEGDAKQKEWEKRATQRYDVTRRVEKTFLTRSAEKAREIYLSGVQDFGLPPMFNIQIQHAIRSMGLPIWFCEGEANRLIAEISRRRSKPSNPLSSLTPIFGVLSNDPDFAIMNGCHLLVASSFDPQRNLVDVVCNVLQSNREHITNPVFTDFKIDKKNPSHNLASLTANQYSPEVVCRSLRVKADMLPEISILAGNDFTKDLVYKHGFKNYYGCIDTAAEDLRQCALRSSTGSSRVDDIPKFRLAMNRDANLQQAAQLSRAYYGYKATKEALNKEKDISQRELDDYTEYRLLAEEMQESLGKGGQGGMEFPINNDKQGNDLRAITGRNCSWGIFPRFAVQLMENKTYWMQNRVEFLENSQYGFDDACVAFRRYLYSVFGLSSQTPITEYGRANAKLCAVVERYPMDIPASLTWHGVKEESKKNPLAYKEALAKLLPGIIQDSQPNVTILNPSTINLATIFLRFLNSSQFGSESSKYNVFLPHEIETSLVMTVLCVMRVPKDSKLTELEKEMVEMFRISESTRDEIVKQLISSGFSDKDDPVGFMNIGISHKVKRRNPDLNGLVCGFRSLVVFGWIQTVWFYILDLMSMVYGAATGLPSIPSFALVLNGDVFRWIYASGTDGLKLSPSVQVEAASECFPIDVSPAASNQLKFVKCLRSSLLNTREVKALLNFSMIAN